MLARRSFLAALIAPLALLLPKRAQAVGLISNVPKEMDFLEPYKPPTQGERFVYRYNDSYNIFPAQKWHGYRWIPMRWEDQWPGDHVLVVDLEFNAKRCLVTGSHQYHAMSHPDLRDRIKQPVVF